LTELETILITGGAGQDARLLVENLKTFNVKIVVTLASNHEPTGSLENGDSILVYEKLNISDTHKFMEVVREHKPSKIFNLAGLSSVSRSYEFPEKYIEVNGYSVERMLSALHQDGYLKDCRFYQASSSEIFDPTESNVRDENSRKMPISPYGYSKYYSYKVCTRFREEFGYFITSGILFNHESEYRGEDFLFGKVTRGLARIKLGLQKNLIVGNLDSRRDWGYARDFVDAMRMMMYSDKPEDYVVATGQLHSVREVIELAYQECKISTPLSKILISSDAFARKNDYRALCGNASKIRQDLGWKPKYDFQKMVTEVQKKVLQSLELHL
jgi:GDPmannose 4,6-dehydratase